MPGLLLKELPLSFPGIPRGAGPPAGVPAEEPRSREQKTDSEDPGARRAKPAGETSAGGGHPRTAGTAVSWKGHL